jgi:hypothetical protein
LTGFAGPKTYAAWPVWSDSTTKQIRFQPMPKKKAVKLWHRARDFDRQTKEKGKHGGAVGHTALQVLHALIFDRLNFASGRLDPSHADIARKANVCERTVRNALNRLRDLGILNWVRRCVESWRDGRFVLEQQTNAYALLPESQWRSYSPPPEPPAPMPGTWGDHPVLPSQLEQAADERHAGGTLLATARILALASPGGVEEALARLASTMHARGVA